MLTVVLLACTEMPIAGNAPTHAGTAVRGEVAVDLPLVDQQGQTFFLADERGKVIFLDMSGFH